MPSTETTALEICGYTVTERLSESARSLVYRGVRPDTGQKAVLKLPRHRSASPVQEDRIKHEYTICSRFQHSKIISVIGLDQHGQRPVLLTEDFDGTPLSIRQGEGPTDILRFLDNAVQLTDALREIHRHKIIYKNLCPAHILCHSITGRIKLIDFSLASSRTKEYPFYSTSSAAQGAHAYISPEQTGRINKGLDYRSDFYSLGVVFYEMLTGTRPFTGIDLIEHVHSRPAKTPLPPHELNADIPPAVSRIILKLLEKSADDRYQSCSGLIPDLMHCLVEQQQPRLISDFSIDRNDISADFSIPDKQYGRKSELEILLRSYDKIGNGRARAILLTGESGSGKSLLLQEIKKNLESRGGIVLSGPVDNDLEHAPCAPLIKAIGALVRKILASDIREITLWRHLLRTTLADQAGIAIDLVPELALIIDAQPVLVEPSPEHRRNQFVPLFSRLLREISHQFKTLVFIQDDLHLVDGDTLELIEHVLQDPDHAGLFIGACPDGDLPVFLEESLRRLKASDVELTTLPLPGLAIGDIAKLLGETLFQPLAEIMPLARCCRDKTAGNPFFLKQFLAQLHEAGAIFLNRDHGCWDSDLQAAAIMTVTPHIGALLTERIGGYPAGARHVLQMAASIGSRFDLTLLSSLSGKTRQQTHGELAKALNDGLVLPLPAPGGARTVTASEGTPVPEYYGFAHEQIRRTATSLLSLDELNRIHVRIGTLMQQSPAAGHHYRLPEMVTHLNHGAMALITDNQRLELAKLNLQAAKQAKKSASFGRSGRFTATALSLLPATAWQTHYPLALDIHSEAAEDAAHNDLYEEAERLFALVCNRARDSIDKTRVYKTRIGACKAAYRLDEAVAAGCEILAELGVTFPDKRDESKTSVVMSAIKALLPDISRQRLLDLPPMTDWYQCTIMDLLLELALVAYQAKPLLIPQIGFEAIRLSLKYGNHNVSSIIGYPVYGFLLCTNGGASIKSGYQFGRLALELQNRRSDGPHPFALHLVNTLIVHWKKHLNMTLPPLYEASRLSSKRGETEWEALCAVSCSCRLFFLGHNLKTLDREIERYHRRIKTFPGPGSLYRLLIVQQTVINLLGRSDNPTLLHGTQYDGSRFPALHRLGHDKTTLFIFHLHAQLLAYLLGRYAPAEEHGYRAFDFIDSCRSSFLIPILHFYHSLTLLALCPESTPIKRRARLKTIRNSIAKMRLWAASSPENYRHRYHLMVAELNRITDQREKAAEHYDRAIALAGRQGYLQEEALAYQLAAAFYRSINRLLVARPYFTEALRCYKNWGAIAVSAHLRKANTELSVDHRKPGYQSRLLLSDGNSPAEVDQLDVMSFIKASRTVSGEVVLEEVVRSLIMILLENAGAEKGFLIMNGPDALMVKVKAESGKDRGIIVDTPLPALQQQLSPAIVNYVARLGKTVALDNASEDGLFTTDRYVLRNKPKSILCLPINHQGETLALVYLENNLTVSAFSSERIVILELIAGQAAISIKNAQLYGELQQTLAMLHQEVAKRKETQMQLLHAGKLSALGRLSASIAHEFGNPLIGIKYLLDDLSQRHELNDEDRHLIGIGLQECERMKHLINDLHDLHRPSTGVKKPLNLNKTVENVLHLQRKNLKDAKITVKTVLSPDLPNIVAVEDQLAQVMVNLTSNAMDAMKEIGGSLVVETAVQGDRLLLRIADNGCGIADEHRDHVFEPFFSTKRYTDGTGLGLAIAYSIVKNHQGDITFITTPGAGTTFTVSFTVSDDPGTPLPQDHPRPAQ